MDENLARNRRATAWFRGLCVLSVVLAGCAAGGTSSTAPQRTATITRGTLVATVNATGNIQPEEVVNLSFDQTGTVAKVNVKAGDNVKKGDVLASLDAADLELALAQAQTALVEANTAYSRTIDGPSQADVDAAQAVLNAAYASYDKVKTGPLRDDYAEVEAVLHNAEAGLKQAQDAYNVANGRNPAGIGGEPAALQLEQATNTYNIAKANYDRATKPPDNAQKSAALQQIESARAALDRLKQPARQYDLDRVEAQRKQALIQIEQARRRLEQAVLRAPRDGLIAAVNIEPGELAGLQPVISFADLSKLHIDITVDEVDVAKIKPGQDVIVTLDALPDLSLKGVIDRIAPTSTTISGVVSYAVRVLLAQSEVLLKAGMTANTSVVLDRRENVLLAPNWAVRRDKKTGKSFITVLLDAKTNKNAEAEVATGMRNETFSEITSGVTEGQVILAPQTSSFASQ